MKPETTGLSLRVLLMMRLETTQASRETMQQALLRQDYRQYKRFSKRMEAVWGFILELYPLIPPILLLYFKGPKWSCRCKWPCTGWARKSGSVIRGPATAGTVTLRFSDIPIWRSDRLQEGKLDRPIRHVSKLGAF